MDALILPLLCGGAAMIGVTWEFLRLRGLRNHHTKRRQDRYYRHMRYFVACVIVLCCSTVWMGYRYLTLDRMVFVQFIPQNQEQGMPP